MALKFVATVTCRSRPPFTAITGRCVRDMSSPGLHCIKYHGFRVSNTFNKSSRAAAGNSTRSPAMIRSKTSKVPYISRLGKFPHNPSPFHAPFVIGTDMRNIQFYRIFRNQNNRCFHTLYTLIRAIPGIFLPQYDDVQND